MDIVEFKRHPLHPNCGWHFSDDPEVQAAMVALRDKVLEEVAEVTKPGMPSAWISHAIDLAVERHRDEIEQLTR